MSKHPDIPTVARPGARTRNVVDDEADPFFGP